MTEETISQASSKRASKVSGTSSRKSQSIKSESKGRTSIEDVATEISKTSQQDEENPEVEEEEPFSYIKMLDVQRELQEPLDITLKDLKQISDELGLIKLCWPELSEVNFEDRTNFPETYLKNSNKEKLLLLYAENFRRQFCYKYPERKPLLLACDNECGMQKMVCTTICPTTLPYSELNSWEECARFVADHLRYEPLEEPVLIVSILILYLL